jgi:hypothetical protein
MDTDDKFDKLTNIIYSEISKTESNNFTIYKNFKKKAFKHIYYLKLIMFIFTAILYEFKIFSKVQLAILVFIILFNLAFIQNMLCNLVLENCQNATIEDAKNNIFKLKKDLLL